MDCSSLPDWPEAVQSEVVPQRVADGGLGSRMVTCNRAKLWEPRKVASRKIEFSVEQNVQKQIVQKNALAGLCQQEDPLYWHLDSFVSKTLKPLVWVPSYLGG